MCNQRTQFSRRTIGRSQRMDNPHDRRHDTEGRQGAGQALAGCKRRAFVRQVQAGQRVVIMFMMSVEHDILPGGHGDLAGLAARIKAWGRELGFDAVGISDTGLAEAESGLATWLAAGSAVPHTVTHVTIGVNSPSENLR